MARSGKVDTAPVDGMRVWFCPGRGEKLAHRIAKAIGAAKRRVRIASPVISSAPILGTLAQVASDGKVDLAGVVDATQIAEVLAQWHENGNAEWKAPLLRTSLTRAPFSGKITTPYAPGSVHDYMHAKVTRRRRHRLRRQLQPLALGRAERRERARAGRIRSSPTGWRRSSTRCAGAIPRSPFRTALSRPIKKR